MTKDDHNLAVIDDMVQFISKVDSLILKFKCCRWIIFLTSFPYILWVAMGSGGLSIVHPIALICLPIMVYIINSLMAEHAHLFFLKKEDLHHDEDESNSN